MSLPPFLPKDQRNLKDVAEYKPEQDTDQMLELLAFYRNKLDTYEKERVEWMCEVEVMGSKVIDHQEQELEIFNRKQAMTEMQKALSDSHIAIYDEKNTVNGLRLKYEDLMKTEKADMRRVNELRALGRELTAQQKLAVNFKDCRPMSSQKSNPLDRREKGMKKQYEQAFYPDSIDVMSVKTSKTTKMTPSKTNKRPQSGKKTQSEKAVRKQSSIIAKSMNHEPTVFAGNSTNRSTLSTASQSQTQTRIDPSGGIVKTVILPYDQINNIKTEVEYLKDYKAQQKKLFEEAIQGFQKDKVIRHQEFQMKQEDMLNSLDYLRSRVKNAEDVGYQISKDYFQYKHQIQSAKDQLKDTEELQSIEKMALCDQLDLVKVNTNNDQNYAVGLYNKKTDNYAERFRSVALKNESDVRVIKQQYNDVEKKCRTETRDIKQNLAECKDKVQIIESRRITETQTFSTDISSIKKRVINFERYIKRLKKHVDEERTEELITELEHTGVAQIDMDQLIGDINKINQDVKDSQKFKLPNY